MAARWRMQFRTSLRQSTACQRGRCFLSGPTKDCLWDLQAKVHATEILALLAFRSSSHFKELHENRKGFIKKISVCKCLQLFSALSFSHHIHANSIGFEVTNTGGKHWSLA